MSARRRLLDDPFVRIYILLGLMFLGLGLLAARLWYIQIARSERYAERQEVQSVRRVRLPAARGRILDCHRTVLAENRPSYALVFYLEELRKPGPWARTIAEVEKSLERVAGIVGQPALIDRADIEAHIRRRLPLPLVAWRDLDEQALARVVEQASDVAGLEIQAEAVRVYPGRRLAAHLLGYVGRADLKAEEPEEDYHYYLDEMAGRSGLEKSLDHDLRGEPGGRLMLVDVTGYRRQDLSVQAPKPGLDVVLTLDVRAQKLAEDALGDTPGAFVAINPNNGDVLALASSPSFDPNQFIPFIRTADWKVLSTDPQTPLLNRAIAGSYPPGSTFKPVTALAALDAGRANPGDEHDCPGYFMLGRSRFGCWASSGHGRLDLVNAIARSCNVYFFEMGLAAGPERIQREARAFGLGVRTGIPVAGEASGVVPDSAWKQRTQAEGWRDGDTCNLSIGQGALTVTPLQMALLSGALANQGTLYKPRLVLGTIAPSGTLVPTAEGERVRVLSWNNPRHIQDVRSGMREVAMASFGSGHRALVSGITMAAKTGSAEYGPRHARKIHAWMIAFAPYENPTIAIAMVVDEGISGGMTIAPRLRGFLSGYFQVEMDEIPVSGEEGGVG